MNTENSNEKPKLAIALQGSFGHKFYAMGIMHAFQKEKIDFIAGSSCVEMMWPLLLYFNDNAKSISDQFKSDKERVQEHFYKDIILILLDYQKKWFKNTLDHGFNSFSQSLKVSTRMISIFPKVIFETLAKNKSRSADNISIFKDLWAEILDNPEIVKIFETVCNVMSDSIPGGWLYFSSIYKEEMRSELEKLMENTSKPLFTNALNAETFQEIYLYSGLSEKSGVIARLRGNCNQRKVLKMNADRFFASGARLPFFNPIEVGADDEDDKIKEFWVEGAMRCNPALNPLIDVGAEKILLVRFFAKNKKVKESQSFAEAHDRYLETLFSAPLEKEIECINIVSKVPGKNKIEIIDPADQQSKYHVDSLSKLVEKTLTNFSHYKKGMPYFFDTMFKTGSDIGEELIEKIKQTHIL